MNVPTIASQMTLRFSATSPGGDQLDAGSNFERSLAGVAGDEQVDLRRAQKHPVDTTERGDRNVAADESVEPVTDQDVDSEENKVVVAADTTSSDPITSDSDEDTVASKPDEKPSIEQALVAALAGGLSSAVGGQSGAGEPAAPGKLGAGAPSQVAQLSATDSQAQQSLDSPLQPVSDQSATGKGAGNSDSIQLFQQQVRAQTTLPQTAGTLSPSPTSGNFSMTSNSLSATSLLSGASPGPAIAAPTTSSLQQDMTSVPPTGLDDQTNIARVVRGISNAVQQNGGTVTLRLQPPELGVVRIQLQIADGTVRAAFSAQTESVRNLLSHQMNQLRYALEAQGIQVERLHVQTMSSSDTTAGANRQFGEAPTDGRSRGAFGQPDLERDTAQDQETSHTDDADQPGSFIAALNAVA